MAINDATTWSEAILDVVSRVGSYRRAGEVLHVKHDRLNEWVHCRRRELSRAVFIRVRERGENQFLDRSERVKWLEMLDRAVEFCPDLGGSAGDPITAMPLALLVGDEFVAEIESGRIPLPDRAEWQKIITHCETLPQWITVPLLAWIRLHQFEAVYIENHAIRFCDDNPQCTLKVYIVSRLGSQPMGPFLRTSAMRPVQLLYGTDLEKWNRDSFELEDLADPLVLARALLLLTRSEVQWLGRSSNIKHIHFRVVSNTDGNPVYRFETDPLDPEKQIEVTEAHLFHSIANAQRLGFKRFRTFAKAGEIETERYYPQLEAVTTSMLRGDYFVSPWLGEYAMHLGLAPKAAAWLAEKGYAKTIPFLPSAGLDEALSDAPAFVEAVEHHTARRFAAGQQYFTESLELRKALDAHFEQLSEANEKAS